MGSQREDIVRGKASPIVFLHGVGLGILPYIPLLRRLSATGHPVVALESCHLGMRWVESIPSDDEVVQVRSRTVENIKLFERPSSPF